MRPEDARSGALLPWPNHSVLVVLTARQGIAIRQRFGKSPQD